jgi:hypothetical protein
MDGKHLSISPDDIHERPGMAVGDIVMRAFAMLLVLLGACGVADAAPATQSNGCKICRDYHQACVKAHSPGACKSEYDICLKHCRQK